MGNKRVLFDKGGLYLWSKMLIFSRKVFLKKFRAQFYEASDKSCPKMIYNTEVPISFLELKLCET